MSGVGWTPREGKRPSEYAARFAFAGLAARAFTPAWYAWTPVEDGHGRPRRARQTAFAVAQSIRHGPVSLAPTGFRLADTPRALPLLIRWRNETYPEVFSGDGSTAHAPIAAQLGLRYSGIPQPRLSKPQPGGSRPGGSAFTAGCAPTGCF